MRVRPLLCALLVLLPASAAVAQATPPTATAAAEPTPPGWSGWASLFTYVVPDEDTFVQPTVAFDRGALHLEGRYNYEDLETGSAWIGRNFSVGENVTLEITPMAGVVFGRTDGVAVGYSGTLAWRRLDLSSETEFVFDAGDSADNFLYTWSELGWSPVGWLRAGLSVQRTKVYQTEFDIQRGFFGALSFGAWEVSAYLFNPDASTPTLTLGATLSF
jgi:hypothetical protein